MTLYEGLIVWFYFAGMIAAMVLLGVVERHKNGRIHPVVFVAFIVFWPIVVVAMEFYYRFIWRGKNGQSRR